MQISSGIPSSWCANLKRGIRYISHDNLTDFIFDMGVLATQNLREKSQSLL
jgi:hypothetical protein